MGVLTFTAYAVVSVLLALMLAGSAIADFLPIGLLMAEMEGRSRGWPIWRRLIGAAVQMVEAQAAGDDHDEPLRSSISATST